MMATGFIVDDWLSSVREGHQCLYYSQRNYALSKYRIGQAHRLLFTVEPDVILRFYSIMMS